jgi:hypothetical protein
MDPFLLDLYAEHTPLKPKLNTFPELELIEETKIRSLLGHPPEKRFEASGVCVQGDSCCVVFDNLSHLARFSLDGSRLCADHRMQPLHNPFAGYEDIAFDPRSQRFFLLIEAQKFAAGRYQARIEEYDQALNFLTGQWAEFPFKYKNKGLEGLACVYLDDRLYLLGLCEGNRCRGGAAGRSPGQGRIQVFERGRETWRQVKTLKLPRSLPFVDYASLDVMGARIAVVSQASSLLWLGTFKDRQGEFIDAGRIYRFPGRRKHKAAYCNIEGIAWLGPDLLLTVSDKRKSGKQAKSCKRKDQSLHLFRIPTD